MKKYNLKTIVIYIVMLIFTVSCDHKKNQALVNCNTELIEVNAKYDSLWQKQLELEQELKHSVYYEEENQKKIQEFEGRIKEITVSNGLNIADSPSFQPLKDNHNLSQFKSNKDIFGFMFNNFVLADRKFLYNISGYNYNDTTPMFKEFRSLIKSVDRSSYSIEQLYTENDKRFIYSLFMHNDYYKTSGLQSIVEGLLLAYEEVGNNEEVLNEMYAINIDVDKWQERWEMVVDITSEEMKTLLSDENYGDETSNIDNRIFYAYTFWARRYHEGNSDIVYKIMSDFHKSVKN